VKLDTEVELLDVNDGDVVVLRWHPDYHDKMPTAEGQWLKDYFRSQGKDVTVLVMPMGYNIERLDEDQMALLGWVRPERREIEEKQ
jgi:predicted esterase